MQEAILKAIIVYCRNTETHFPQVQFSFLEWLIGNGL